MVVVTSAKVAVATDAVGLFAYNHGNFRVNLEAHHAVGHMHPRLFESPSPTDIGLFVESRFDFDQHRHLFAALGRINQRIDDRAIAGSAIKRELDGEDRFVTAGLTNKLDNRSAERRIRMVQQDISKSQHIKQVARLVLRLESRLGDPAPMLPLLAPKVDVGHGVQRRRVQRN